jgi:chromosome segregation ATPase
MVVWPSQTQQLTTEIQRLGSAAAAAEAEVGRLQAREAALVASGERSDARLAQLQEAHSLLQTSNVALEDQVASLQVRWLRDLASTR